MTTVCMLRLDEVMKITGLSRSTLYALIKRGEFPQQVPLGPRMVRWKSTDVDSWVAAKIAQAEAA